MNPKLEDRDRQAAQLSCAGAALQQGRAALWPIFVFLVTIALGGLSNLGCVATAECDEYVGCSGEAVCYQGECRTRCDDDGDCASTEECAPCYGEGDDTDGQGRCYGEEGSACVATSNSTQGD